MRIDYLEQVVGVKKLNHFHIQIVAAFVVGDPAEEASFLDEGNGGEEVEIRPVPDRLERFAVVDEERLVEISVSPRDQDIVAVVAEMAGVGEDFSYGQTEEHLF